jgi:DNA-cytosine methyltransferase
MAFTFVDLFCGIGGFHHALAALGGRCVLASDIDAKCRANYALNFGLEPAGDIRKVVDVPDHDILCAGFPCQPFSTGGHRAGFTDEARGTLIYEVVRILEGKRPKGFILENVKGLLSIQEGHVMQTILHALDELGYWVNVKILSPDAFGVPQHRERVYFIGIRKDVGDTVEIPLPVKQEVSVLDPPDPAYSIKQDLIADPNFDVDPFEMKHRILIRNHWNGPLAKELKPNAETRHSLQLIIAKPLAVKLSLEERDLLWKVRYVLF